MTANSVLEHIVRHLEVPTWFHVSQDASTWGIDHSLARLSNSIVRGEFGMDQAVLLRQCIRHLDNSQRIVVPTIAGDLLVLLERVGIRQALDGTITALPYRPEWLSEESNVCVDLPTLQPSLVDRRLPGEPWLLERLGTNHWKSNAQKEAAWSALCAPAGSSLLIGLPTGAGKSLVYQCCAAYETGLTVLVVPTVALGLDQLAAVRQLPLAVTSHPRLYSSGPEGEEVMRVVRAGQCRLLITSPEAIVAGRLKNVLAQCAIEGRLRRVVVDEAHIVESWGADFRIEFQLLGSLLREWRRAAPEKLRLLLLSATFAPGTLRMLKRLFASDDGLWEEHIIQRLRPEIHYFAPPNWVSKEEQLNHVQEALHYLPRPAILYVTEKKHADYWVTQLTEIGFRRLAGFHGDTAPTSRDEIMRRWRNDELDWWLLRQHLVWALTKSMCARWCIRATRRALIASIRRWAEVVAIVPQLFRCWSRRSATSGSLSRWVQRYYATSKRLMDAGTRCGTPGKSSMPHIITGFEQIRSHRIDSAYAVIVKTSAGISDCFC